MEETTRLAFATMIKDKERFGEFLSFLFEKDVSIIYVPMHKKKEKARGFNQAAVLAREVAKLAQKELYKILEKVRETKAQVDLSKEERLYSVKGVFKIMGNSIETGIEKVILIDDVWTTGATMKECCKVLKKSGIKKVWGFTLARTP